MRIKGSWRRWGNMMVVTDMTAGMVVGMVEIMMFMTSLVAVVMKRLIRVIDTKIERKAIFEKLQEEVMGLWGMLASRKRAGETAEQEVLEETGQSEDRG